MAITVPGGTRTTGQPTRVKPSSKAGFTSSAFAWPAHCPENGKISSGTPGARQIRRPDNRSATGLTRDETIGTGAPAFRSTHWEGDASAPEPSGLHHGLRVPVGGAIHPGKRAARASPLSKGQHDARRDQLRSAASREARERVPPPGSVAISIAP